MSTINAILKTRRFMFKMIGNTNYKLQMNAIYVNHAISIIEYLISLYKLLYIYTGNIIQIQWNSGILRPPYHKCL